VPVDFLSDAEAVKYGRYDGAPTPAEFDKVLQLMILAGQADPGVPDPDGVRVHERRGVHAQQRPGNRPGTQPAA
jgi:hypothetical protein